MLGRLDRPDAAFGILLVAVGVLAFVLTGELAMGSAASMGPGYVPRGLAILVGLYGATLALRAALGPARAFSGVAWRPLAFIGAAVALFAVMLPTAGLALTGFVVVVCAGLSASDVRLRENALLGLALAIFAVLLFAKALGLPIAVWPRWI